MATSISDNKFLIFAKYGRKESLDGVSDSFSAKLLCNALMSTVML